MNDEFCIHNTHKPPSIGIHIIILYLIRQFYRAPNPKTYKQQQQKTSRHEKKFALEPENKKENKVRSFSLIT